MSQLFEETQEKYNDFYICLQVCYTSNMILEINIFLVLKDKYRKWWQ